MQFYELIEKKKHGGVLSNEEITEMISLYVSGEIADYQMSAMLMAIYFKGMTDEECRALTDAIYRSGDIIDLSSLGALSADKHSSGGVGDKTTLIVAPLAAALGCRVAKMSGRGLGHTGGTIDKLEAIPGYRTTLAGDEFLRQSADIGVAVIGQSKNLTPADKKLYALRDVTATVDSIPLITASIMGKKLAAGAKNITLDVKCGSGAFMKDFESAARLAQTMVTIGKMCGRNTRSYVTDMDFPLGREVGNICEVKEAINVLSGMPSPRLRELCIELAASMAYSCFGNEMEYWRRRADAALTKGDALKKFKEWLTAQGADTKYIDNPELFPKPKYTYTVHAGAEGYISRCNTEAVGLAAMALGAGRRNKDDKIDMTAGITLLVGRGDYVAVGDSIACLYSSCTDDFTHAKDLIENAYEISEKRPKDVPIILASF